MVNAILILLWNSWKWMDTTKLDTARTLWSYLSSDEAVPWMSLGGESFLAHCFEIPTCLDKFHCS